jgi:hypothetical protein
MALGGQVVDLVGLGFLHQADQIGGVGHIAMMQNELDPLLVQILVQWVYAPGVERGRPPLYPVDGVTLLQQQRRQIRTVLDQ